MIEKGASRFEMALETACRWGHLSLVQLMIDHGAHHSPDGLKWASYGGHLDVFELMVKHFTKLDLDLKPEMLQEKKDALNHGLYYACLNSLYSWGSPDNGEYRGNDYLRIIPRLIELGADDWDDALVSACDGGNLDLVKLMIKQGATHISKGLEAQREGDHHIVKYLTKLLKDKYWYYN